MRQAASVVLTILWICGAPLPIAAEGSGTNKGVSGPQAFCEGSSEYAPDGKVVRVGTRYFRLCDGAYFGPGGKRESMAVHGPALKQRVGGWLIATYSYYDQKFTALVDNILTGRMERASSVQMGGLTYEIYYPKGTRREGAHSAVYLYRYSAKVPQAAHLVFCLGMPTVGVSGADSMCSLYVSYYDGVARTLIFDITELGGIPIPFDKFPTLAVTLWRNLEAIDVTDETGRN